VSELSFPNHIRAVADHRGFKTCCRQTTVKALGLDIPPMLLARADELIE